MANETETTPNTGEQAASASSAPSSAPAATALSPAITHHPIVICVEKHERGVAIEALLKRAGYAPSVAVGMYDALKLISQEMPHLVVCDSTLADGTAVALYNKVQQTEAIRPTPILVNVVKKTREEVASLQQAKFAGFILGTAEPAVFLAKVKEVIGAKSVVSPYFIDADGAGIPSQITISMDATLVGRNGDKVVAKSATELDPVASVMCVSRQGGMGPALLRMATNMKQGAELYNIFPISKITGSGLKWIVELPDVSAEGAPQSETSAAASRRKIVLFDPNEARAEQFRKLLSGYDIEVIPAKTLGLAGQIVKREPQAIGAVYLHELLNDASSMEWKNSYGSISINERPPLIVGTTSQLVKSNSSQLRYIKRPFGLGQLVEALEAAMERPDAYANQTSVAVQMANLPVSYQAPGKLVGLDEAGGIIQMRFPVVVGSKLEIANPVLKQILGGKTSITISSVGQVPGKSDCWQARFLAVDKGTSKAKYYAQVKSIIANLAASVPKAS